MYRGNSSASLDKGLVVLAVLLAAAAMLFVGLAYVGGLYDYRVGVAGWITLISSGIAGSAVVARRAVVPLKKLEERAESERRSRGEAEWLRRIAERVAVAGEPGETLDEIAQMEAALLGFTRGVVRIHDPEVGMVVTEETPGPRIWRGMWETVTRSKTPGQAVFVRRAALSPPAAAALAAEGAEGALLTPVYRAGALSGVIVLFAEDAAEPPSAAALDLASIVGHQASLVLENAYLYQQFRSRASNLETIFRITQAVGSSLQTRVVLNRVLDVVQKILSADAVLLMRYDGHRREISTPMARGILSHEMLEARYRPGEDVPGRVFEDRAPELYGNFDGVNTPLLRDAAEHGLKSLMAVPLMARGRSIGVLIVLSREEDAFSAEELDLVGTFASQAALAIDNAEMFSREHDTVRVLQQSVLPVRLPEIPGIEAASIYLPGGGESEIGGDYYDLYARPSDCVMLSIGDVCGKGVNAATKTSMLRHALRGMIVAGLQPAEALCELNRMLVDQGDVVDNIVTLWLGQLDTCTGRLVWADGGHPAGLMMRPDGSIERLAPTGALLGGIGGATWQQEETQLVPGCTILLYTDGVTEARRGTRFFGEGRVRRALRAGGSASEVAERLLRHMQRFAGKDIRDDAAILVAKYVSVTEHCQDVTRDANSGKCLQ